MKILVVSERLSPNDDDGIKNIALAFLREAAKLGHQVSGLSEWTAIPEQAVELMQANRWYWGAKLKRQLRRLNPDLIIYVPWTSATGRSLVRLANLKRYAGGAQTIIVATQPMPFRWFERPFIRLLRPDRAIVMSETTETLLQRHGIKTHFMPAGFYPASCRPQPERRRELRERYNLPLDRVIVTHVGHLKRERIAPGFLEEFNQAHPDWLFLWVGSPHTPAEEDYLQELEQLPGVVVLREYLDQIADVYNLADLYIFPVQDPFACVGVPLSIIEAAACNRPVVAVPFQGVEQVFTAGAGFYWATTAREFAHQAEQCLELTQVNTSRYVEQMSWQQLVTKALAGLSIDPEWVTALLNSKGTPYSLSSPVTTATWVKFLRRNKIPLLAVDDRLTTDSFTDSTVWQEIVEQERLRRDELQRDFLLVSQEMQLKGCDHLLLKSAGEFPYHSDNFDLLVREPDLPVIDRLLRELGYSFIYHYREDFKLIYKLFRQGRLVSIMHLHTEISWGVERFLDIEQVWRNRRRSPRHDFFEVPAPEEVFLTTMAHGLYENDRFKIGDYLKAVSVITPSFDWEQVNATVRSLGWKRGLAIILNTMRAFEQRFELPSILPPGSTNGYYAGRVKKARHFPVSYSLPRTKLLFLSKLLANPTVSLRGKVRNLAVFLRDNIEPLLKLKRQRSMLISISGIDGCGKSTVISGLEKVLTDCELRHRTVWLRLGNSDLVQKANNLFKRLLGRGVKRVITEDRSSHQQEHTIGQPLVRLAWSWISFSDLLLRIWFQLGWHRLRRRVVILDRYWLDSLVDYVIRTGRDNFPSTLTARLLKNVIRTPELAFYLRITPEESLRRKQEEFSLEQLRRRYDVIESIVDDFVSHTIDSLRPVQEVQDSVIAAFLQNYYGKP